MPSAASPAAPSCARNAFTNYPRYPDKYNKAATGLSARKATPAPYTIGWVSGLTGSQATNSASAQLRVVNGDFSDLSGLATAKEGWRDGLPKGWQGTTNTYAIDAANGATPPTCNPSTLARDLKKLKDAYDLQSVQMVDFFPNTFHIEAVALLKRK